MLPRMSLRFPGSITGGRRYASRGKAGVGGCEQQAHPFSSR